MPSSACCVLPRHLPPFPTRRSSDLRSEQRECQPERHVRPGGGIQRADRTQHREQEEPRAGRTQHGAGGVDGIRVPDRVPAALVGAVRSEEHTSELQSLRHLVCRLLHAASSHVIYPLSLHDALPISGASSASASPSATCVQAAASSVRIEPSIGSRKSPAPAAPSTVPAVLTAYAFPIACPPPSSAR